MHAPNNWWLLYTTSTPSLKKIERLQLVIFKSGFECLCITPSEWHVFTIPMVVTNPPTLTGAGHQWTVSINTGCNQWFSLAKLTLKVVRVGRNRSPVVHTSKRGCAVSKRGCVWHLWLWSNGLFEQSCQKARLLHKAPSLIAHPHLLVRAINERFLPSRNTFRNVLASESQWLQPVLVLTVRWWPNTSKCGWAISASSIITVLLECPGLGRIRVGV